MQGGVLQVLAGSSKQALVAPTQTITKNGYLYVYVSNESPQDVFFDDITVKHTTGPLAQEQSYYPFGLQMAAISDKAIKKNTTPYKYNAGSELEEELNYYSTFYRKYDAQIGRFTGVDILSESSSGLTPYQFGGNNPVMYNDPSGAKFVPDWIMQASDQQFNQIGDALNASNTAWLDNPNHIGSSGGSSGGTTEAIEGGYRFTGTDAVAFLHGFLNAYKNPAADGSWSFTVGRNSKGDIIYGQENEGETSPQNLSSSAAIVGIHSNYYGKTNPQITSGHAWISISNLKGELLLTACIWDDDQSLMIGTDPNHTKSDVRLNTEINYYTGPADSYYQIVNNGGLLNLYNFINTYTEWSYSNTCAIWASHAFYTATGVSVSYGWFGTPHALADSIREIGVNTSSNPGK